ncbi:MAG: hypothetical protein ACRDD8_06190 [Bacteroidales bacterium]
MEIIMSKEYNFANFLPNKEEKKAIESIARAFAKAKKLGLSFYGKNDNLVVYTADAEKYINSEFRHIGESMSANGHHEIPHATLSGCISDSGADDCACFKDDVDYETFMLLSDE